jgi:hypothetical protein
MAPKSSRKNTTPAGPACANSLLAKADPNWTELTPPNTRTCGGTEIRVAFPRDVTPAMMSGVLIGYQSHPRALYF